MKKDPGAATSAPASYWHCSHPFQHMGGICAVCLNEQLSAIAGSRAEMGQQAVDSEGSHNLDMSKQVHTCGEDHDARDQEMSARHSSAGSEQSIASLVERDIDKGRQRYSDVIAVMASSYEGPAPCAKQVLARSRSCSAASQVSSKQSTPAGYSKNSSFVPPNSGGDEYKFRRWNTARAETRSSNGVSLLAKCKSTGYMNKRSLRLPANGHHHGCSLPKFWHKKCAQAEERRQGGAEASSRMQADAAAFPAVKERSSVRGHGAGAKLRIICEEIRCMGIIKWLTSSSFHLLPRSSSGKPSSSGTTSSHDSGRPKPLISTNVGAAGSRRTSTDSSPMQNGREVGVVAESIANEGAAANGTCPPTLFYSSAENMVRMQPHHHHEKLGCQSIAALVSMDAHLIHHLV